MRRVLFACLFLCLVGSLFAQVTSRLGRFQVDKIKGCAPFTVTITNTNVITTGECTSAKPCIMTFEGGTQQQNTFTHTYSTPGTYTLSVLYQSIGADDIIITVDQNIPPPFEVYRCSGNDVTIRVTDNHYEQYVIDFADGTPTVAIPFSNNAIAQHNYATAGIYNIAVRGRDSDPNAADNCTPSTQPVTTLTTLPTPTISTLTAVSPTSVRLELPATTPSLILYRLEIAVNNGATFQVLQNVYGITSIDVSNLLLDHNFYCFRLGAFDPCTGTSTYSNTVCTQDFDVAFNNGTNLLTWRTLTTGMASVTISRNDVSASISIPNYVTLPGVNLFFRDLDYDCNHQYCYRITVNQSGGARSTSLEKCGTGLLITTHPAIDDVLATVANGATLSWEADPLIDINEFQILKSVAGSPFGIMTNTTNTTVSDATYTTETANCYRINYKDQCENYSADGIIACPVRLFATIDDANAVTMNWSKYQGWQAGVGSYFVEKLNTAGNVIGTFDVDLDTALIDNAPDLANQIVSYRVRVLLNSGITPAYSNVVTFTKEVNLTLPTAFTPNGDGLNDLFSITGQYVSKMNIRVFDRWGILVFASDGNEPWNGTREGTALPESAYVWKAEIIDLAGRTSSQEGTVLLLRK